MYSVAIIRHTTGTTLSAFGGDLRANLS